ncbi:rhodanese-related sulfurtransferase [Rhodocyclus tenuis]|uniref:Rhodanese-related sulfurtransferase n=2 Tax=Rhodocyclus TaxID=1064 RepID=A0A6L5JYH3_RHOTE|nr:rhodanese homology domain-containing protein [Rhodocyclus gracilis]MQY52385.1 rhodanese-related sulfurtransferase [Rhodocyclus gracilis]NJA88292.1 rhodanese-related sulfurtransferase [Rhodocyclus gracilis]
MAGEFRQASYDHVRTALLERREIAFLDVREEDPHAQSHPLFAANFPLGRIELNAWATLPRRSVPIVTIDNGEGDAERAAGKLAQLGYNDISVFSGGIAGWAAAGGELFRDVNVPSKAFGELVEARRHTPSFTAEEVKDMLCAGADVVVVDVRRFDEYRTMNIPGSTNVPGAELILRVPALAKSPATQIIVNCAGRTRSIIGTQSLINAGLPNPVAALRNGTIGWTLAGQTLQHGQSRRFPAVDRNTAETAAIAARRVADRAGVKRAAWADVEVWLEQRERTTYFFDVRDPSEYEAGHLPGFRSVAGGQLVQETEMVAPVRGARIVLADDLSARAEMTASWLAQMNWEVFVLDDVANTPDFSVKGPWQAPFPPAPAVPMIRPAELATLLERPEEVAVLDLTLHANYLRGHIPGAWYALRSRIADALARIPPVKRYVLTCASSRLALYAHTEIQNQSNAEVVVLEGGNAAWEAAGLPLESGPAHLASPPIDRYRRPYEGTDNAREAMQAYLDWEFGLVEQLRRDGTHGFFVI